MLAEDDNTLDYSIYYKEKEYLLNNKGQENEEDQRDLVSKSLDNESVKNILSGYISQDGLLANKSSLSLREVRFNK